MIEGNLSEMRERLAEDPGDPVFATLANQLRGKRAYLEALEVCLQGLSHNPDCHTGRLALARVLYEAGYVPFAIRELELLARKVPENTHVAQLRELLAPDSTESSGDYSAAAGGLGASAKAASVLSGEGELEQETLAEGEFDIEDIEFIDDPDNSMN